MKSLPQAFFILAFAALGAVSLCADQAVESAALVAEITKKATTLQNEKKFEEARAELSRIETLAGATAAEKDTATLAIAGTWSREREFEKAATLFQQLADSDEATPAARLRAIHGLFASLQSQKKPAEARAVYLKALETPELNAGAEEARFLFSIAKTYEDERNFEKSAAIHAQILANPDFRNQFKVQSLKYLGKQHLDAGRFEEARGEYRRILSLPEVRAPEKADAFLSIARSFERQRDFENARLQYAKGLEIEGLDDRTKGMLLAALARSSRLEGNLAGMQRDIRAHQEFTGSPDISLLREYALLAALQANLEEEEMAWRQILEVPELGERPYNEAVLKLMNLLVQKDSKEEAAKLAAQAAGSPLLDDAQKFLASLIAAGFAASADGKIDFKKVPVPASLDPEQQLKAYLEAGKVFMISRDYEVARAFAARADTLFQKRTKPVYTAAFMEAAPFGVSGWKNSDLVKEASRREARFEKYNQQAADLLINDVNVARTISSSEPEAEAPVSFFMAPDRRGLHIYVEFVEEEVDSVLAGLVRGDSLEMFFAPGRGECYYQIMLSLPSGEASFAPWMSPHRNYRKIDDFFVSEVAPVPKGFGVYMMIPWDLVYDKLPREGDRWPFGIVNFGRRGGFTWGGGQVHEMNRFGEIKFSGVDRIMPQIRRLLVMKAYGKYKESSASAARFWNDEIQGDRKFYTTVLLPKIEELGKSGELVTGQMSQADVDKLFSEVVGDWMEFDYLVSELRREYIQQQLFVDE